VGTTSSAAIHHEPLLPKGDRGRGRVLARREDGLRVLRGLNMSASDAREVGTLEAMGSKKKTKKNKPINKPVLAVGVAIHLAAATLTWRDISSRPADRIRGTKTAWQIASAVNTIGSVGYWLVGRRYD
jgi:hypothetical protein